MELLDKAGFEDESKDLDGYIDKGKDEYQLTKNGNTTVIRFTPDDGKRYDILTFKPKKDYEVDVTVSQNHSKDDNSYTIDEYEDYVTKSGFMSGSSYGYYGYYAQNYYNKVEHDDTETKSYQYY